MTTDRRSLRFTPSLSAPRRDLQRMVSLVGRDDGERCSDDPVLGAGNSGLGPNPAQFLVMRFRVRAHPPAPAVDVQQYLDAHYGGWADPLVIARAFLRADPDMADSAPETVASWFARRSLNVRWVPRLTVGDRGVPLVVTEPAREGVMLTPRVFGDVVDQDGWQPITLKSFGGRYCQIDSAMVTGGWDVVETDSGACWPALTPESEALLISNALSSRLVGWTGTQLCLQESQPRAVHDEPVAIVMVGEHSTQFGHWLTDYVPRLLATRALDVRIPVVVDAGHHASSLWWLERLAPGRRVIELAPSEALRVERAYIPLSRTFCPTGWRDDMPLTTDVWASDPWAAAAMQVLAIDPLVAPIERTKRLWLARRGGNKPLVNQDELAEWTWHQHGFDVVYPEDLPVVEMGRLLASARDVIAPIGSQLFNLLLARAGLNVLVLVGDDAMQTRGGVISYATAGGHRVALVGGVSEGLPPEHPYEAKQRPYRVTQDVLADAMSLFFGDST